MTAPHNAHYAPCKKCGHIILRPPAVAGIHFDLDTKPLPPADVAADDAWWPTRLGGWGHAIGKDRVGYVYRTHVCPGRNRPLTYPRTYNQGRTNTGGQA